MYNIAKVAKGEILRYFNEVFDAMGKVSATENAFINLYDLTTMIVIIQFFRKPLSSQPIQNSR